MNISKDNIAFDQFQRYETISRLIEFYRNTSEQKFHVLELGANEHKDLKLFLPKDQILFTDIYLTPTMENDPEFQQADATNLPYQDSEFEFVVAADVFEHISPEKKQQFLSEACRVASKGVILSFPYYAQCVIDAERRINTYYKTIAGEDFIWLKEHEQYGLPKLKEIDQYLQDNNYQYFSFFHGDLQLWEKMWYCHFNSVFMPETLEYCQNIDHYYNSELYCSDISATCYRVFYVLGVDKIKEWESYAHALWKPQTTEGKVNHFLTDLLQLQENLHNLYEVKKNMHDKDAHIKDLITLLQTEQQKHQEESIAHQNHLAEMERNISLLREENVKTEQKLQSKCAEMEESIFHLQEENRRTEQELRTKDSELNKIYEINNQFQAERDSLKSKYQSVKEELEHSQIHCNNITTQNEELQRQLNVLQIAYDSISNAFFWKITKPFRIVLDLIKKVLKKNQMIRTFYKGLKSLKQNGFSVTWDKVKQYRNKKIGETIVTVITEEETQIQRNSPLPCDIKFSIVVPLYNTNKKFLHEMISSVLDQTYRNWELCLVDASDEQHFEIQNVCEQYSASDTRVRYIRLKKNLGISANTNEGLKIATGDYIGFLDHDDLLMPNALYENAKAILETKADILYSDEDHLSVEEKHVFPLYKPDWSPDLLYSQMYICHFLVVRKEIVEQLGGFSSDFDGSQDYDFLLRASEITQRICHIPMILYTWRESENSTAINADSKPYAHDAGRKALEKHIKTIYGEQTYVENSQYTFVYTPRFHLSAEVLVSIIIPMKDKWQMSSQCIESILQKSSYQNFEIIILNNRSQDFLTFQWFEKIQAKDKRVRVLNADMEFNWSKLNNYGATFARGDVYIFLNNDTLVISEDWIERLSENALRKDVGVVGPMLLYADETIQHAGVVVGIGGWADHVYKGTAPVHCGSPYISPMVSRNVLAVTGACMAISKRTRQEIGPFDEEFIICGSDVELGIRAYEREFYNRYDANVRLYHLESKSRDSFVPEIDFQKSSAAYDVYRQNGDPFYNVNLSKSTVIPEVLNKPMPNVNLRNYLKRFPFIVNAYHSIKNTFMPPEEYNIPEIGSFHPRKTDYPTGKRLNLLVPSVDKQHVFGGIATALKIFTNIYEATSCDVRIITTDAAVNLSTSTLPNQFHLVKSEEDSTEKFQVVAYADRATETIPISANDYFIATSWWSAYIVEDVIRWQSKEYGLPVKALLYIIQDYEPGFYAWSSRYLLAESTYHLSIPTYAIINSSELKQYLEERNYTFERTWIFDPILNDSLKNFYPSSKNISKKKQIIVYGRPSVQRNAFAILIAALKKWATMQNDAQEWSVYSLGEAHDDIALTDNLILRSKGKLSLEDYARFLLESYAGVSLMVSPHPSYPPLEMSAFGVKTITNSYANKDLSDFSKNIISLHKCTPDTIAERLVKICTDYSGSGELDVSEKYVQNDSCFQAIGKEVAGSLLT